MYDDGHFCLGIQVQGVLKEHFKKTLIKKVSDDFLLLLEPRSKEEEVHMDWMEIWKSPLFDPATNTKCDVCLTLNTVFLEKLGNNDGVILFSNNVPDALGFHEFFPKLFEDKRIKKLYYFELPPINIGYKISVEQIRHQKVKLSEFLKLIDDGKFETHILYEISQYYSKN